MASYNQILITHKLKKTYKGRNNGKQPTEQPAISATDINKGIILEVNLMGMRPVIVRQISDIRTDHRPIDEVYTNTPLTTTHNIVTINIKSIEKNVIQAFTISPLSLSVQFIKNFSANPKIYIATSNKIKYKIISLYGSVCIDRGSEIHPNPYIKRAKTRNQSGPAANPIHKRKSTTNPSIENTYR